MLKLCTTDVQCGFDVRKHTDRISGGVITLRYLVCNREGKPNTSAVDTLDPTKSRVRRNDIHRRECKAGIKFRYDFVRKQYEVYEVDEMHNHKMLSPAQMNMSRAKKQLDVLQRSFIYKMSHQNVRPTVAHRLYAELKGGYSHNVSTHVYFKICIRDLNCHIGEYDAQLSLKKITNRKKNVSNFSFYYREENKMLNTLFWEDDTSKLHHKEFGDVLSFDATFRTNRYDMVFVPFTGVDNHKKSVTFGDGLLSREDTESYTWLLQAFVKTFTKHPILIISDQDPAMKRAINTVFPESHHRLCMWHITSKLSNKVTSAIYHARDFKKKFNELVWNSRLSTEDFEKGWEEFIDEYELHDNRWFRYMYNIREQWIPAYFKHIPMSGLMTTTSRPESENAQFQKTVNPGTNLINFMMSFESSMERQRFNQCNLDFTDVTKFPLKKTSLLLEIKTYNHYTKQIFHQVQIELYHGIYSCTQWKVEKDGIVEIWTVREKKNYSIEVDATNGKRVTVEYGYIEWDANLHSNDFQVACNVPEKTYTCTCLMFENIGILCRHIFCAMKRYNIDEIPKKYILKRWGKDLIPIEKLKRTFRYGDMDEEADKMAINVFLSVDRCLKGLTSNKQEMAEYVKCVQELEVRFGGLAVSNSAQNKTKEYDILLGVSTSSEVDINNPDGIRNKGCGKRTRMKSAIDIRLEQSSNQGRICNYSQQRAKHDIRNCPVGKADEASSSSKKKK